MGAMNVPVATPSPKAAAVIGAVGGLFGGIGSAVTTAIQNDTAQKVKNAKNLSLEETQQQVLAIEQGHSQGKFSQDEALRKLRVIQSQAIANNPSLREDVNKLFSDTLNSGPLSQGVRDGTQSEQDDHALLIKGYQAAETDGFIIAGMSDAEKRAGYLAHQQVMQASARLKALKDKAEFENTLQSGINARLTQRSIELGNQGKVISNQTARINLAKAQHEQEVIGAAKQMYDGVLTRTKSEIDYIIKQRDSGQLTPEASGLALKEIQARLHAGIDPASASGGAASSIVTTIGKLIDDRISTAHDYVTGKTSLEAMQTDTNRQDLISKQAMLQDNPTLARSVTLLHLVGTATPELSRAISAQAVHMAMANDPNDANGAPKANPTATPANLVGTGGASLQDAKQYLDMASVMLRKVNSKTSANPEDEKYIETHVRNIVGGIGVFGQTANNPTRLDNVVSFLAGDEFGTFSSKHPAIYTAPEAASARTTIERYYTAKVIPLIQSEFLKDNLTVGYENNTSTLGAAKGALSPDVRGTAGVITVGYDKNNVRFTPNPQFRNNEAVVKRADQLNKEVGPVINKLVKAQANLDGSLDYSSYFPKVIDDIIPAQDLTQDAKPTRQEAINNPGPNLAPIPLGK